MRVIDDRHGRSIFVNDDWWKATNDLMNKCEIIAHVQPSDPPTLNRITAAVKEGRSYITVGKKAKS
jgi:hypothetical protein